MPETLLETRIRRAVTDLATQAPVATLSIATLFDVSDAPRQDLTGPPHRRDVIRARTDAATNSRAPSAAWAWRMAGVMTASAALFVLVRPGVNDVWAARARAWAVHHGATQQLWLDWYAGAVPPGQYSVLSPRLSSLLGSELAAALASLIITALVARLVHDQRISAAAGGAICLAASCNLWSGRVALLLGAAAGAVTCYWIMTGPRRLPAVLASVVCVLCSPLAALFLLMAITPPLLHSTWRRQHRSQMYTTVAVAVVIAGCGVVLIALFGRPGPEHFSAWLFAEYAGLVLLGLTTHPRPAARTVYLVSLAVGVIAFAVPNGVGSNMIRWTWFVLPVLVLTTSRRPRRTTLAAAGIMCLAAAQSTIADLQHSSGTYAQLATYQPLIQRLQSIPHLYAHRLELVTPSSHAGDDLLLGTATLARGWESQADRAYDNDILHGTHLTPSRYRHWLDTNAVAYIAVARRSPGSSPTSEWNLVHSTVPQYMHRMWTNTDWALYSVSEPTPIVSPPATLTASGTSQLALFTPSAGTLTLRIRYTYHLRAHSPGGSRTAIITPAANGWTQLHTEDAGEYIID